MRSILIVAPLAAVAAACSAGARQGEEDSGEQGRRDEKQTGPPRGTCHGASNDPVTDRLRMRSRGSEATGGTQADLFPD